MSKKRRKKYPEKKTRKNTKTKKTNIFIRLFFGIFKLFITLFLIGAFIGVLLISYTFITTDEVLDQNFWISKNTTQIVDRDNELIQLHGKNIKYVELDDISQYYLDGIIATEDSNFYKHTGVDFKGMIRAVLQTLFTSSDSGGSTITMQLAKNLYLQGEQEIDKDGNLVYNDDGSPKLTFPYRNKIGYKIQQMVYAWKIEAKYSKDEILANYVNSLEFDGPIGIEKASVYYFGVSAKNLNLSQAATLAGMTQQPYNLNPNRYLEASTTRRNIVLQNMLNDGKITQEEYKQAKAEKIENTLVNHDGDVVDEEYEIIKPYLDEINMELQSLFGSDFDINSADATIYTSLDYELQEETYHIINNDYGNIRYESDYLQAGSATIDTPTGEILAIGGGRRNVDIGATQNYGAAYIRQPGSTAKPIVDYGPALEYLGWSTYHQMTDKSVNYTGGPAVANAYGGYLGTMSIQEALSRSTNTIALQTFQQVVQGAGIDKIEEFMTNLGIDDVDGLNEAYSIGGWDTGTTPVELAGAYATFGNGGLYNQPHAIRKIEFEPTSPYYEEYGSEYTPPFESNQAMSASTAYMMTKMLDPNLPTALTAEMYVSSLGDQGIKTGTSNWPENNYNIPEGLPRDKWVAGYSGDVTTVIWTGFPGTYEEQGYYFDSYGFWSYDIYKNIMQAVVNSEKDYLHDDSIVASSDVYSAKIDGNTYYFKKGTNEYEAQLKAQNEAKQKEKEKKEKEQKEKEQKESEENNAGTNWNISRGSDDEEDNSNETTSNDSSNEDSSSEDGNESIPFT